MKYSILILTLFAVCFGEFLETDSIQSNSGNLKLIDTTKLAITPPDASPCSTLTKDTATSQVRTAKYEHPDSLRENIHDTADVLRGELADSIAQFHYDNLVTVAQTAGDFNTIMGAINSVSDADSLNRHCVFIYPGLYEEQITMKEFVDLYGVSEHSVRIQFTGNDNGTIIAANWTHIQNLRIEMTPVQSEWAVVCNNVHNFTIRRVNILGTNGVDSSQGIKLVGNDLETIFLEHMIINYLGTTGHGIYIECDSTAEQNGDMTINDVFLDALHVTTATAGCMYIKNMFNCRIRSCLFRTSASGYCLKQEETGSGRTGNLIEGSTMEYGSNCIENGSGATVLYKHSVIENEDINGSRFMWASTVITPYTTDPGMVTYVTGDIHDTADALRGEWTAEISDTADAIRSQMSDTADVVRGELTDTAATKAGITHASNHEAGGSDELFDQNLNTTDDVTFNTVTVDDTATITASSGDPTLTFTLSGGQSYTMGVDNSDGDYFKLSPGLGLAAADYFLMNSSGGVGVGVDPSDDMFGLKYNPENDNLANLCGMTYYPKCTSAGTYHYSGMHFDCTQDVDPGEDNDGTFRGIYAEVYKKGGGNLQEIRAFEFHYGIDSDSDSGNVNYATGLYLKQHCRVDTLQSAYDIYIAAPSVSGGHVTSDWCFFSYHDAPSRIVGGWQIDSDVNGLNLGAGQDTKDSYDGTNRIIDCRVVGSGNLKVNGDVYPYTDDTYYVGKNDDDSPFAYKGVILKDQTDGKYYRIELNNGSIDVVDLTD